MFEKAQKILVISAHADDMELGCGATIDKLTQAGKEVHSLVLSVNNKGAAQQYSREQIVTEAMEAGNTLGIPSDRIYIEHFENRTFPSQRQAILDKIWEYKRKLNPDFVITGAFNDMHQDHATVAQESFRAFKDCSIIAYAFDWNRIDKKVNAYSVISEENLAKKVKAIQTYTSQTDTHRAYLTEEYIRAWAFTRGVEVNAPLAEAFEVIRLVN